MLSRTKPNRQSIIILDNIRSVHNVGSIFRTSECAGVEHIYCVGTTPVPIDRFGRKRKDFAKVSLGAEELVGWDHVADYEAMEKILKRLRGDNYEVIAVEQSERSVKLADFVPVSKVVYIFGNEVSGVGREFTGIADKILEIPMFGEKESLNVSVTAGIVIFHGLK